MNIKLSNNANIEKKKEKDELQKINPQPHYNPNGIPIPYKKKLQ